MGPSDAGNERSCAISLLADLGCISWDLTLLSWGMATAIVILGETGEADGPMMRERTISAESLARLLELVTIDLAMTRLENAAAA